MIDKRAIRTLMLQTNKEGLLQFLDACLESMNEEQLDSVFGNLYYEQVIQQLPATLVLAKIKIFLKDSLAGMYYAPFEMDSKNYTWIPPETDAWYNQLSMWIDRSCELVQEGHRSIGKKCLDICFQLIDKQADGDTVFAHESGDWMIHSQHDYEAIYKSLK